MAWVRYAGARLNHLSVQQVARRRTMYSDTETNLVPSTKHLTPNPPEEPAWDYKITTCTPKAMILFLDRWQRIIDEMIAEAKSRPDLFYSPYPTVPRRFKK